jgi:hypothetical protein
MSAGRGSFLYASTIQQFPPSKVYHSNNQWYKLYIGSEVYVEDTSPRTVSQVLHHYHKIKHINAYSQNAQLSILSRVYTATMTLKEQHLLVHSSL